MLVWTVVEFGILSQHPLPFNVYQSIKWHVKLMVTLAVLQFISSAGQHVDLKMMNKFAICLSDMFCMRKRPVVIRWLKYGNLLVMFSSFHGSDVSSACTTSWWLLVLSLLLGQLESWSIFCCLESSHSACVASFFHKSLLWYGLNMLIWLVFLG